MIRVSCNEGRLVFPYNKDVVDLINNKYNYFCLVSCQKYTHWNSCENHSHAYRSLNGLIDDWQDGDGKS